jgi:hypothetical protein
MNTGDIVIAMRSPGTICAIGEIISEPTRYWKDDENFRLILVGGRPYTATNPYGEVRFFNKIDVRWIPRLDKIVKVSSLDLDELIKKRLLLPPSIIRITANDFDLI